MREREEKKMEGEKFIFLQSESVGWLSMVGMWEYVWFVMNTVRAGVDFTNFFTSSFFVRKCFPKHFSNYSLAVEFFVIEILAKILFIK